LVLLMRCSLTRRGWAASGIITLDVILLCSLACVEWTVTLGVLVFLGIGVGYSL
jgi:hypothetical protein